MQACTYLGEHKECDVRIVFQDLALESKADMPSEDRISDVSLMIFDGNGMLERHFRLENASRYPYIDVSLLKNIPIHIIITQSAAFCNTIAKKYAAQTVNLRGISINEILFTESIVDITKYSVHLLFSCSVSTCPSIGSVLRATITEC